jgi:predicted metalloprotease
MRFNRRARLDSSEVQTRRGGAAALGGGAGIIGVVVVLALQLLGGGGGDLGGALGALEGTQVGGGETTEVEGCRTGADAAESQECRIVAVVNSIQDHWATALGSRYEPTVTNFFTGSVSTGGCGSASSAVGPFYCPADQQVYVDLGFFDVLEERFGGSGGDFAEAYVLAHEYGHHVQNLLGVRGQRDSGAESDAVRQDPTTGEILILDLTEQDIREALDAAAAVGDDRIQEAATGDVDPHTWTHGSAEQRQRWFMTGYRSGSADDCDTFAARSL